MKLQKLTTLFYLIILLQSCTLNDHTRTYRLPKTNQSPKAGQAPKLVNDTPDLNWVKPESWVPSSGSNMRLASFDVPYAGGVGDLALIQLSGNGGGMQANVNRWRRQLGLEPQSQIEIEASALKIDGKLGQYSLFRIINDVQKETAFLCAIIPLADHTLFIKLATTPSGVKDLEADFTTFCSSLNYSNQ